jgi:hypothetical protein
MIFRALPRARGYKRAGHVETGRAPSLRMGGGEAALNAGGVARA